MNDRPRRSTLPRSADLLGLFVDHVTDYALFFIDPDGTIISWSPGVLTVLGYEEDEFIGRPVAMLFTEEDRATGASAREMEQAGRNGRAGDDRWHVRRDGSRVFVYGSLTALRSHAGDLVAFAKILRDRTEHLDMLRQLEQERARAAAANEEKEAFMAVLAHELHRPLNAIRGWAHMAVDGAKSPDQISVALHRILRSSETMLRLVNDLLDVSRIVSGKLQLAASRIDLAAVVEHAVAEIETAADDKQIALSVNMEARPVVSGDPNRLAQVVSNLLSNAVKYTPQAGGVTVTVDRSDGVARVLVADTGQGIAPDELPHIFQRFRQLPGEARGQSGLGLGLWVSQKLVTAHGGMLTAASHGEGKGSTFVMSLPALT